MRSQPPKVPAGPGLLSDLKLRRDLWQYIAVLCNRCGWVDTFEQRINRAIHHVGELPAGYIWSECGRCALTERIYDPGVALLLRPS